MLCFRFTRGLLSRTGNSVIYTHRFTHSFKRVACRLWRRNHALYLILTLIFFIGATLLINKRIGGVNNFNNFGKVIRYADNKKDLLNIDISGYLRYQNWDKIGFDPSLKHIDYTKILQTGFISNLDTTKLNSARNPKGKNENSEQYDETFKLNADHYTNHVTCNDLQYNNTLEYYISPENLKIDLARVRRELLNSKLPYSQSFTRSQEKDKSNEEVAKTNWFGFGNAAIWLESENCYVTYSRATYSHTADERLRAYISVVVGQAYDKNWNELIDKRIMFRDIDIPKDVAKRLNQIEKKLNHQNCKQVINDNVAYETCITTTNRDILNLQKEKEEILDKYSIKYPSVLKIPFKIGSIYNGPEDPHVTVRKDKEGEEPIVVFNMDTNHGRKMHAFLPHRKNDPFMELVIPASNIQKGEKNWTPIIHKNQVVSTNHYPGYMHLVYDYNPLEVIRCSLLTGQCEYVFQAETLDIEKGKTGILRGGTQYVSIPDIIPEIKGKNMWVGFTKTHVKDCGCGSRFYRPVLTLMIEVSGVYHIELITPNVDFNEDVLGWNLKDTGCGGYNVLSPISIANWQVVDQDAITGRFEDYMTLTISEADYISKRVVIKGVLNYILGIYKKKDIKENFVISAEAKEIVSQTSNCVLREVKNECKRYAITHPDLELEKKKEEEDDKKKKEEAEKKKKGN